MDQLRRKFFWLLSGRIKIHQILVIFETINRFFLKFCVTLQYQEIHTAPLYFFSRNFIYFQQKEPIKVQIWWNFTWAVKSLTFCSLIGSFCINHIKFQLKKYRRVVSHDIEKWCKVYRKTDLLFHFQVWHEEFGEFSSEHSKLKWHEELGEISLQHSKVWKIVHWRVLFAQSIQCFSYKVSEGLYNYNMMQNLKENLFAAWKMTWGIWLIFMRAVESLKICTLIGSFCLKHLKI